MDKPPGKHEEPDGGDDQRRARKEPSVKANHQNSEGQKQHEGEAAEEFQNKKNLWQKVYIWFTPDKVQAGSAVIQAICAAALVILTINLWLVTRDYSGYTAQQARAEATSASAAKRAADAEATSAANETRTLGDEEMQAKVQATNFTEQLDSLTASVRESNRLAKATEENANISGRALSLSEQHFAEEERPYIIGAVTQITPTQDGFFGWTTWQNVGKTPAVNVTIRVNGILGLDARDRIDASFASLDSKDKTSEEDMGPSASPSVGLAIIKKGYAAALIASLAAQNDTMIAIGRVGYFDIHKRPYYTDICFSRRADRSTPYCSVHNEIK